METLAPFIAYAVALGIAALIPGPGVAALVGQSLGGGVRPAMAFLLGLALGDVVYLTIAIAGLAALTQLFAGAVVVLKVAGGLYLLHIAYRAWTADSAAAQVEATGRSDRRAALAGFVVTLGNPKTIVFYLALLPTVLDLGSIGPGQWALLSALTLLVLFATLTPYALLAVRARRTMARPEALAKLNRIAAGVIGGAGLLILGQAAQAAMRRS